MLHRRRYSRVCLRHKSLLLIFIDCSLYLIIFSVVHCAWFLHWVFISILGWACDISLQDWPSRALRSSLLGSYLRFRSWSTSSVASQDLLVGPPHVYCLDSPLAQAFACLFRLEPMLAILHYFSRSLQSSLDFDTACSVGLFLALARSDLVSFSLAVCCMSSLYRYNVFSLTFFCS